MFDLLEGAEGGGKRKLQEGEIEQTRELQPHVL
jgi:hypothetical protein